MKYKIINSAIINGQDVPQSFKTREFYQYLLDNNVAYYYVKAVADQKGKTEKKILETGDSFNSGYLKTLMLIFKVSKVSSIKFVLFKTFKHIPEAVDGDVDIFLKKEDFEKFINLLEKEGFTCEREKNFRASCFKNGFCKIEPRTSISFYGKTFLPEEDIWKHLEKEHIGGYDVYRSSIELDMYYFLLNTLYGPNYMRLYHYLIFKKANYKKMLSISKNSFIRQDLQLIRKMIGNDPSNKYFPLFLRNLDYLDFWVRRIFSDKDFNSISKFKSLVFFFYAKYGYLFFGRLPFRHDWNIPL